MNPVMLFPGQGSQYVGMAAGLIERHSGVRRLYDGAKERIGVDLAELSVHGPAEELRKTSVTQPAIYLHSVALALLLADRGVRPAAVAGHSLGEYSALAAAGYLDPLDGLELVRRRGVLMYGAGMERPGTMAAVIGLDADRISECCRRASAEAGIVQPANYNCPGQVAISGSLPGVERAVALLKESGARLVKLLDVSGAFHSPLMESARRGLKEKLEQVEFRNGRAPLYCNVTGEALSDPAGIRDSLGRQLGEAVQWEKSVGNMLGAGLSDFLELGPGKVLSGLMRRIDRRAVIQPVDTAEDLEDYLREVLDEL